VICLMCMKMSCVFVGLRRDLCLSSKRERSIKFCRFVGHFVWDCQKEILDGWVSVERWTPCDRANDDADVDGLLS
jgi:hypothetical protein